MISIDGYRFYLSCSGFNVNDGWFLLVGSVFKTPPTSIVVIATKENNGCSLDKIEQLDKSRYKIFVKDITRDNIAQKINISLNLFYSTEEGKLLMQTIYYDDRSHIELPKEITF